MDLEVDQLNDYRTFRDLGKHAPAPKGYKKIRVHFVFAVKHDGRHKARPIADGHLTDAPVESVYSSVVSLQSLRLVVFIAELNELELWAADVGNAYLEAYTKEKVYIIAGKGFGKLEGHTLIIVKALYGLRSSGKRYAEKASEVLRAMGFTISRADPDVWMRRIDDHYEYIAVYVDDLAIASKNPKAITDALQNDHKLKLKGVGPLTYHLGCDFFRDKDGTLCYGPRRYIEKLLLNYENLFNSKPKMFSAPLERNDHPELDDTVFLEPDDQRKYLSLVGALQWAISLGRFDIGTSTMTMSRFRVEPSKGHMERVKRIIGYLRRYKNAAIRVRVRLPDIKSLPQTVYDWAYTTYGNVKE